MVSPISSAVQHIRLSLGCSSHQLVSLNNKLFIFLRHARYLGSVYRLCTAAHLNR